MKTNNVFILFLIVFTKKVSTQNCFTCPNGQYQTQACTISTDTICANCTQPCLFSQFESTSCTALTDRVCSNCPTNKYCDGINAYSVPTFLCNNTKLYSSKNHNIYHDMDRYKVHQFLASSDTTDTSYQVQFKMDTVADVLIVGGGGGGGSNCAGAGGAGALLYFPKFNFKVNTLYTMTVGGGGPICSGSTCHGITGGDSSISDYDNIFRAKGGGGGHSYKSGWCVIWAEGIGFPGGSAGGDGHCPSGWWPNGSPAAVGQPVSTNIINRTSGYILGNKGGASGGTYSGGGGGADTAASAYTAGNGAYLATWNNNTINMALEFGKAFTDIAVASNGKYYVAGGGSGTCYYCNQYTLPGGLGGGGYASGYEMYGPVGPGVSNTGSGGGGGGCGYPSGQLGNRGASGFILLRYESCCGLTSLYDSSTSQCKNCQVCAQNQYRTQICTNFKDAACKPCPLNFNCNGIDAVCVSGYACTSYSSSYICTPGTFSLSGATSCTTCPIGTYSTNYGSTNCEYCPIQMNTTGIGKTTLNDCLCISSGWYKINPTTCNPCLPGYACPNSNIQSMCASGTFSSGTSTTCTSCTTGKYSNPGASECIQCSPETFTLDSKSCSSCNSPCSPDQYENKSCTPFQNRQCAACPSDTMCNGTHAIPCPICSSIQYETTACTISTLRVCSDCPSNFYCDGKSAFPIPEQLCNEPKIMTPTGNVFLDKTSYTVHQYLSSTQTATAIYNLQFKMDTVADVLLVGGGGAGGSDCGGGGGAGSVLFFPSYKFEVNKKYTVTVGGGGDSCGKVCNGYSGKDSIITDSVPIFLSRGGGGGTKAINGWCNSVYGVGVSGGSASGGGTCVNGWWDGKIIVAQPASDNIINKSSGYILGNKAGYAWPNSYGGGGGGSGTAGNTYTPGSGLSEIIWQNQTTNLAEFFGKAYTSLASLDSDGKYYVAGGGSGSCVTCNTIWPYTVPGSKGGGGFASGYQVYGYADVGLQNTGSGGGGGGCQLSNADNAMGKRGASGFVLIKYLSCCGEGTWKNTSNTCRSCSDGCPIDKCPDGMYTNNTATTCSECANGTSLTANVTNIFSCSTCPIGTFTNNSYSCITCKAGTYSKFPNMSCTPCIIGKYNVYDLSTMCMDCPLGYYTNSNGSTACTSCPQNSYCVDGIKYNCPPGKRTSQPLQTSLTQCFNCSMGYFCPGNGENQQCSVGKYTPSEGSSMCYTCEPQYFCTQGIRNICPNGTYNEIVGATMCLNCTANSYCTKGKKMICPPGFISDPLSAVCNKPCPLGYFCPGNTSTLYCPIGTYSLLGSTSCTTCEPGYLCTTPAVHAFCPINTWSLSGSYQSCSLPCPAGVVCLGNGKLSCTICTSQEFEVRDCDGFGDRICNTQCPPGMFGAFYTNQKCVNCPVAQYNDQAGSSACFSCTDGTFTNVTGSSACQTCPIGKTTFPQSGYSSCVLVRL